MLTDVLLVAGIAAFVAIRFLVEPKLRRSARTSNGGLNPGPVAIARQNVTRFLGTFSGCTALGAAISKGLTYWVASFDVAALSAEATKAALEEVAELLEFFQGFQEVLSKIGAATAMAPVLLLGVGLLYWSIRSARSVDAAIQREVAELRKKAQAGTLEKLPPDEQMREVEELIAAARADGSDGSSVETLYQLLLDLDLARRVDPSLLRMAGLHADPGPWWLRALGFMISGTVFKGMARFAMAAAVLANISLIPASLIFTSRDFSDAVAQVTRSLEDAKRDLALAISSRRVDAELRQFRTNNEAADRESDTAPTPPDVDSVEACSGEEPALSESDCETAAEFGRAFETRWAYRLAARAGAFRRDRRTGQKAGDAEDIAAARREWSRRQVLSESVRARQAPSVGIVEQGPGIVGPWERVILDAELTARSTSRPVTRVGRNAELHLREILRAQPGNITVAVGNRPLTRSELLGKAFAGITNLAIDRSGLGDMFPGPEPASKALGETLKKVLGDWGGEIIRGSDAKYLARTADLVAKEILVEAAKSGRISDAVMTSVLENSIDTRTAQKFGTVLDQAPLPEFPDARRMRGSSVALEARPDPGVDSTKIEAALRKLGSRSPPVGALASYSSIFPGVEGQAARSLQAEVLRTLDSPRADARFGSRPVVTTGKASSVIAVEPGEPTPVARMRLARARSYSRLRGFARVGGVLIGRPPEDEAKESALNLTGFTFSITSDDRDPALTLRVRYDDGTEVTLGPYDPAIAHFALVYAADGRPTTVTMVKAEPLFDLKILLHPAIIDTGLGCRAIRLDQFVDEFGGADPKVGSLREQMDEETKGLVALYRQAWATRFAAVTARLASQFNFDELQKTYNSKVDEHNEIVELINSGRSVGTFDTLSEVELQLSEFSRKAAERRLKLLREEIEDLERLVERSGLYASLIDAFGPQAERIGESRSSVPTAKAIEALLNDSDRALQPLRERPAYFDERLVEVLKRCAESLTIPSTADNPDTLSACVERDVTRSRELGRYKDSKHFSWLAPPSEIVTWAGVRERTYTLDHKLTFAQPSTDLSDGPLRFIVQNAFETPAFLSRKDGPWYEAMGAEEVNSDLDPGPEKPWEFNFGNDLQRSVLLGVQGNVEAESVLYDMHEFTVVQRLFRAAFDGRLGIDFPVEQLAGLAKETATHVNQNRIRTPRWNERPWVLEEYAAFLESTLKDDEDIGRVGEDCLEALRLSQTDAPSVSQLECTLVKAVRNHFQPAMPDSDILGKATALERQVNELVVTLELRKALGVADDWKNSSLASGSCPSPSRHHSVEPLSP